MVRLSFSEPKIVAVGPDPRTAGWGPYQFPELFRTREGRLVCTFQDRRDSTVDYNLPSRRFVSRDGGESWQETAPDAFEADQGVLLPNGERVFFLPDRSVRESEVSLPKPVGKTISLGVTVYRVEDFAPGTMKMTFPMRRVLPDGTVLTEEPEIRWKHAFVYTRSGMLVLPSARGRLRIAPDGTLWMPHYTAGGISPENGGFIPYHTNYLFSSSDGGRSWDLRHFLPYVPDIRTHPQAYFLEGWNENDIGFAPDGTCFRLVRLDGRWPPRHTPMHIVRSADGTNWTDPEPFSEHGVWPCILTLRCGVTLASYGRPGVKLRATADPSCRVWDEPVELVHSDGKPQTAPENVLPRATCGYTEMIALDDHTAAMVYTDFTVPDAEGNPHKTVLFRTVTAE